MRKEEFHKAIKIMKSCEIICRFSSDDESNKLGFQIRYNSAQCNSDSQHACRSVCRDYSTSNGLLISPYYPAPYPYDTDCTYTISQNNGTYIMLEINYFDIYQGDFLEIRDGKSGESPIMGFFDGYYATVTPAAIKSTNNNIWMR